MRNTDSTADHPVQVSYYHSANEAHPAVTLYRNCSLHLFKIT